MNRPTLSLPFLILLAAGFMLLTCNYTFFATLTDIYPFNENMLFVTLGYLVTYGAIVFLLSFLSLFLPVKFVLSFCFLTAAASGYFADTYHIVIDDIMIQNTMETNLSETQDLLNVSYLGRLFGFGLVPILLVLFAKVKPSPFLKNMLSKLGLGLATLLISVALIYTASDQFSSFFREHKQARYYISPVYPVYSLGKYIKNQIIVPESKTYTTSGIAAHLNEPPEEAKELVILVVGETARADHFSLNGYERETNPLLAQEKNLISYPQVQSCGTSTAISVPCLFSLKPKDEFKVADAKFEENVLDLIAKAGVNILWRDNNSDSKNVADRLEYQDFKTPENNKVCADGECRDIGMLDGLQDYIDNREGDILIVLHQMGSHGPAYYQRYPKEFEKFTPSCQTLELASCSKEEIRNAYDNTILYTDYFLSEVIKLLKKNTVKHEPVMFYVSDHGESLGENGIYLHGLPYMIAPEEQKHVAMMVWGADESDIDIPKTRAAIPERTTHDSIASTLVQIFEIESDKPIKHVDENVVYLKEEEEE